MISTAFLTDYNKRIYVPGAPHNQLRLFCGLIPGSEIVTAEYQHAPDDFNTNWFDYRYLQDHKKFIHDPAGDDFKSIAQRTGKFLNLWSSVISKLNFVYRRDSDPFNWNVNTDPNLIKLLDDVAKRCESIISVNFKIDNYDRAKYDIDRETILNIFL